jgi:hypothetical protein
MSLMTPESVKTSELAQALDLVGLPVLIGNATTALALNIAVVFLIGCASSLEVESGADRRKLRTRLRSAQCSI